VRRERACFHQHLATIRTSDCLEQKSDPSRCQFHQRFTRNFFIRISPQSQNVTRKSYQKRLSYKKNCMFYVYENDGSCQFHQRLTRKFFIRIIRQSKNVTRKSCQKRLFYEKIRAYNVDEIDASKRSSSSSPTSHAQHHSSSRSCGSRGDIRARRYVSSCLNKFTRSFYAHRSQKHKLTDDLTAFFCAFGIYTCKSCT